jgi:hypothetical protein
MGGYTGMVNFSCGTLPAHVSCTFAPPSISITSGSGPVTDTLTINTAAPTTAALSAARPGEMAYSLFCAPALVLPELLMVSGSFRSKRNRSSKRRFTILAFFCVVFLGLGTMTGCGGGGGGSHASNAALPGTYSIPISVTVAGQAAQNVSVTVVVH